MTSFHNFSHPDLLAPEAWLHESASLLLEELEPAAQALMAALAQRATGKNLLILTCNPANLYHDLPLFTPLPVIDFPAWETLPQENVAPSADVVGERYQLLHQLESQTGPLIVLASLQAVLQKLLPKKRLASLWLSCKVGDTLDFTTLPHRLVQMGYTRVSVATDKGQFAVRGGIIDLFPVQSTDPFRLEFFDDQIISIRIYDPIGQKSVRPVTQIDICAGQELELLQKEPLLASLLDHLGPNTLVVWDDLLALEDRYAQLTALGATGPYLYPIEQFLEATTPLQALFFTQQPLETLSPIRRAPHLSSSTPLGAAVPLSFQMFQRPLEALRVPSPFHSLEETLAPAEEPQELLRAAAALPSSWQVHYLCQNNSEETVLARRWLEIGIEPKPMLLGYLSGGFALKDCLFFPSTELTHRFKLRRQKQRTSYHSTYSTYQELLPGDIVVHYHHGIGRFTGIEKRPNHEGISSEFFLIEYADNGKLYVPIQQSYLVSKYIGSHEEQPTFHVLGENRWKRTKEKTQNALVGYAKELLELYARREIHQRPAIPSDSEQMRSFEEEFPFVETEDQLSAIAAIKQDLMRPKAMDRLVCGDVGYGKTEVAMRAAFKAVVDGGQQVAILVPTTVLATQHYENFCQRMASFPLRIELLSRLKSAKETGVILKGLQKGTIDIVVGTHRLLNRDVAFAKLGLVIIDEEQRFGVKAKEHLKTLKMGVDCLTLSATPIPRTLYFSLVGAKDMSVISSPPQDRLPIKTILAEPHKELIHTAIARELARQGQVYFIHNRVETIHDAAAKLREQFPLARIVVGHGQMDGDLLDGIFHAFKQGQADILVATSIVENGIDIPNANTILIDRADRFGLADLYQLRGRVGRWNRLAYAYFLVPRLQALPEQARKRLEALSESSGYGGGMKLAMRDLEIRGAGELLGEAQSGHVSSVGFHLYCKMLTKTIQTLQGHLPSAYSDVKLELPFDARLPESYVPEASLRLEIYQRLGDASTSEELDLLFEEVKDRYGTPPLPVQWLYQCGRLKIWAQRKGLSLLKLERYTLHLEGPKSKISFLAPKITAPQDLSSLWLPELQKRVP